MLTEEQLIGWNTAHHIRRLYEKNSEQGIDTCALHLAIISIEEHPDLLKILSEILNRAEQIKNNMQTPDVA